MDDRTLLRKLLVIVAVKLALIAGLWALFVHGQTLAVDIGTMATQVSGAVHSNPR